jgi:hypothetical protein
MYHNCRVIIFVTYIHVYWTESLHLYNVYVTVNYKQLEHRSHSLRRDSIGIRVRKSPQYSLLVIRGDYINGTVLWMRPHKPVVPCVTVSHVEDTHTAQKALSAERDQVTGNGDISISVKDF